MKYCKTCGKKVGYDNLTEYCFKCYKEKQSAEKINNWLRTGDAGIGVSTTLRGCIRDFILKSQNGCCNICGMSDSWNGKNLVFILDHIDGDASNNCRENLRLKMIVKLAKDAGGDDVAAWKMEAISALAETATL